MKVVYCNFNHHFSPTRRRKRNCMLFTAKGNITITVWSAHAPTAHVVIPQSPETLR
jgi:hypothetical protein